MQRRSVTGDDLVAVTSLVHRFERHFFGSVESDAAEVEELLAVAPDPATRTRLLSAAGRPIALGAVGLHDTVLTIDPDAPEREDAARELVAWVEAAGAVVAEALDRDEVLRAALVVRGWTCARSSYELVRGAARLEPASWPDGIEVTDVDPDADAAAVHELVYARAGWAETPGHPDRSLADWETVFLRYPGFDPDQQVLARRDGRPVGVALGRTFSDGTGYVQQLAVDRAERRNGLGRALLLEAFGRRLAGGARRLALTVQAENAGALRLYRSVGLEVDRAWGQFLPPVTEPSHDDQPARARSASCW